MSTGGISGSVEEHSTAGPSEQAVQSPTVVSDTSGEPAEGSFSDTDSLSRGVEFSIKYTNIVQKGSEKESPEKKILFDIIREGSGQEISPRWFSLAEQESRTFSSVNGTEISSLTNPTANASPDLNDFIGTSAVISLFFVVLFSSLLLEGAFSVMVGTALITLSLIATLGLLITYWKFRS